MKYPLGFEHAWAAYPHEEMGIHRFRSIKSKSLEVWKRRKLEDSTANVIKWVESYRKMWESDGYKYVPGFQVFIGTGKYNIDFRVGPPKVKSNHVEQQPSHDPATVTDIEQARKRYQERQRIMDAAQRERDERERKLRGR